MNNPPEHVASQGLGGAVFYCTPLVAEVFARHHVGGCPTDPALQIVFPIGVTIGPYTSFTCRPEAYEVPQFGAFSYSHSVIERGMSLGRYCSVGSNCRVMAHRHPVEWSTTSPFAYQDEAYFRAPYEALGAPCRLAGYQRDLGPMPKLGNDVWIGQDVLLARNITIGDGAVIAAGAVVTKDVAPYMIVGGAPAAVLHPRFDEKIIARFLASRWWDYDVRIFRHCDFKRPEQFLDDLEQLKARQTILPYRPDEMTYETVLKAIAADKAAAA